MELRNIGNKDTKQLKGSTLIVGVVAILIVAGVGVFALTERNKSIDLGALPVNDAPSINEGPIEVELEFLEDALLEQIPSEFDESPSLSVMELPGSDDEVVYQGEQLAGTSNTPVLDFNKSDYEVARAAGKDIVLYFYAFWCPICQNEVAAGLYPAFAEIEDPNVIAFRVNFNDSDTDNYEEALADQFGVTYQHTKVLLRNGSENVLQSFETWTKERYLEEITEAFAGE